MPKFDNKICFENLMYLYKVKGMKIGEFENLIGASTGHFSRLQKEDGKLGSISSELLFNASDILEIPVEILGSVDLKEMDSTEKYLFDFINKLTESTKNKSIDWLSLSFKYVSGEKNLVSLGHSVYDSFGNDYFVYNSSFWDEYDFDVNVCDKVLYFLQKNGYFILTKVNVLKNNLVIHEGYELYFKPFNDNNKIGICSSSPQQKESINNALNILYKTTLEYIKLPKVNNTVKSAIDLFMNQINDNKS